eukprot:169425_1
MGKTTFFNNGKPQIEKSDGKMQPIIVSDGACWDCFWAPCIDMCGLMPYVSGVPAGSKPISDEEKQEILNRWEGQWDVQPLPRMAVKGPSAKFYVEYTAAYFDDENIILSGGTSQDTRTAKSKGSVSTGVFTSAQMNATTKYKVDAPNEGQVNKLIFLRSPDGSLFIDNVGTRLVSEEPGKLKFKTAAGWPMVLRRDVVPQAPEAANMQHS